MNFLKSFTTLSICILIAGGCAEGDTAGTVELEALEFSEQKDLIYSEEEQEDFLLEEKLQLDAQEVYDDDAETEGDQDETTPQCPGHAGCECSSNDECYSGFCIPAFDKNVCAQLCLTDESCPQGWKCVTISTYPDIIFGCVPLFQHLCKPCKSDSDCFGAIPGMKNLCLEYDSNGSYCGSECEDNLHCPEGFECKEITVRGSSVKQCFPLDGECLCFEIHVKSGAKTFCYVQNDFGKCIGERLCSEPCPAPTPDKEKCDNIDNDCDTQIDEENALDCSIYCYDGDGDYYGLTEESKCLCSPFAKYNATLCGDCNDKDENVNPSVTEICNGADDNCNGLTDEEGAKGCMLYYKDADNDGFGEKDGGKCLCQPERQNTATIGGDCNDENPQINPSIDEACNGFDDNCDNTVDNEDSEGCVVYFFDNDGDGYGTDSLSKCLCSPIGKYTTLTGGDCDDQDSMINPQAKEVCNLKDDDCNKVVDDEGALNCIYFYYDSDNDGYGLQNEKKCLCTASGYYRAVTFGDCNDNDSTVHPFALEKCNGKDDNCLNGIDEEGASDCTVYYYDYDNDGFGMSGYSKCLCSPSGNFNTTSKGDCNDNDKKVNPAESEKCNNKDDNCNNNKDEGTAVDLCGSISNGTPKCENGTCKISSCATGWEDTDGQFNTGCECEWDLDDKSGYGNSCPETVIDLGTLTDNSAKIVTKSAKINPGTDVDWYKFTAIDAPDSGTPSAFGNDKFHIRVRFLTPVSNNPFAFDIFRGGCANILCSEAREFNWFTNGRCGSGSTAKGEAPCISKKICENENVCPAGTPANHCADVSAVYYIKVKRLSGAASACTETEYSLEVSNGAVSAPPCPW